MQVRIRSGFRGVVTDDGPNSLVGYTLTPRIGAAGHDALPILSVVHPTCAVSSPTVGAARVERACFDPRPEIVVRTQSGEPFFSTLFPVW